MNLAFDYNIVLNSLVKCRTSASVTKILSLSQKRFRNFSQIAENSFCAMGWEYILDNLDEIKRQHSVLELANNLNLSSAPQIKLFIELEGDFGLLVTCFKGCEVRELKQCLAEWPVLGAKYFQKFVDDNSKLAEAGYYHQVAMTGSTNWYINPDSQDLVFTRWESVRQIAKHESERLIETSANLFNRYDHQRSRINL